MKEPWFEIVGVGADVTNQGLQAPVEPQVWVPFTVTGSGEQVLLVRSQQTPMALMRFVKRCGPPTDADVASALEDHISQSL